MNLALKEWASVIRALESGTQILLFRKGGISETSGDFRMEHDEFLLYPTYEHQNPEMVKPEHRHLVAETQSERTGHMVRITSFARVGKVFLLHDRKEADALRALHIWDEPYVDLRFDYKPDRPLYVVLLRVFRLREPIGFVEKTEYVGCRSWVPLEESADPAGAVPVLADEEFRTRVETVQRALGAP